MNNVKSKLFKQRLFRLHIAAGACFSIIMYISIFFGIFAIMLPYIKTWEKPSRHIEQINLMKIDYNSMIDEVLKEPDFPQNNIMVNLPGFMEDPALVITHRFTEAIAFNPSTKQRLDNEPQTESHLAEFLNELHYGAPLEVIGRIVFGFVAVGTMFLIVTGLILIALFKFKNSSKNQQAVFSKIHVKTFSWIFLPFFLIVLSGAVMNVGLLSSAPMSKILSKGESNSIDAIVGTVLFPQEKAVKKENIKASMLPLSELLAKAKQINPELTLKQVKLVNWYDKSARVEIIGYNPYKPFLNGGIFNKPYIVLNATNGELIKNKKVLDNVWPVFVSETIFFLHFLFGIDIFSRIAVAIIMALCCIAIGFAVMLWLEKKAKAYENKAPFYHGVGKFSLAAMIGIIPATSTLFVNQWLLPFGLEDRVLWQQGIFYNTWLFTLFWSFYRINSYKASKEFFFVGGVLFSLSSLLHLYFMNLSPFKLLENDLFGILGVDIVLVLLGITFIYISKKLPKDRNEAKKFWPKKKEK